MNTGTQGSALFDFGLMLVISATVCITALAYQFTTRLMQRPWLADGCSTHYSVYNRDTAIGSARFSIV